MYRKRGQRIKRTTALKTETRGGTQLRERTTVREPKNTRRLRGYKGIRIGEASHPGPGMNEDAEIYEGKRGMAMGEAFKEAAVLFNNHGMWKGDNLTRKGNSTGMRLAI